jgi:glycosyltransferase involved in cell wall biosynthesis
LIPRIEVHSTWAGKNLGRIAALIDELHAEHQSLAADLRLAVARSLDLSSNARPNQNEPISPEIAYLANSPIPTRAANCVHVMRMCSALATSGHSPILIAQSSPEGGEFSANIFDLFGVEPFRVSLIQSSGNFTMDGVLICREGLQAGATHFFGRSLSGCYAAALAGMPTALEQHLPIRPCDTPLARDLFRQPAFRGLIVITQALKNFYKEMFPELLNRIWVVPDAADPPPYGAPDFELATIGDFRVGYAGHLYPGKGAEIILQLAQRLPHVGFHVLGGYEKDVAVWRSKARGLFNIVFYGFRPQREVSAFLSQLDVVVAPYLRQVDVYGGGNDIAAWMSPLKLFEYMAHELPIVSSDLPVLREVLKDQENALLCDPDDIGAWVSAIERLRLDDQLRAALARRASEDFALLHTWEKRVQRILRPLLARDDGVTADS